MAFNTFIFLFVLIVYTAVLSLFSLFYVYSCYIVDYYIYKALKESKMEHKRARYRVGYAKINNLSTQMSQKKIIFATKFIVTQNAIN